jgi:hypothetical protein
MRFLWLTDVFSHWPFTNGSDINVYASTIYKEGPRDKFHCVMLATQQEIGLFILKSLPIL